MKRKLTKDHHCEGDTCSGWASVAARLKRAQRHDFLNERVKSWEFYPCNRFGWVTDTGRFLGVGLCARSALRKGESIARIDLPFQGSGKSLREQVSQVVARRNLRVIRKRQGRRKSTSGRRKVA